MTQNTEFEFQAEVSRLLDIVTHALYSNSEVFLRELISNAADACDRLRYEAIQNADLTKDHEDFQIRIKTDSEAKTLTISDNGIGMNREDLIENLGTIARSGTAKIMEQLKQSGSKDLSLIGQFGVGFYASFMVADKVTVTSKRAGEAQAWEWVSDGKQGYTITQGKEDALFDGCGTAITLHLSENGIDYLLPEKVKQVVARYSDHIDIPVYLNDEDEALNQATALWARNKSEVTEEQYKEFYHSLTFGMDDPLVTAHWRAEGVIEYNALLFVPTLRPFDIYDPNRKHSVRLYVKRVFITDDCEGLIYPWLRFVRGVVDSQDLPLNISREMLQSNPVVTKIRQGITKRILGDLKKLSENDETAYNAFWGQFGAVIKEGLYDAYEHRDAIFDLCRFASTDNPQQMISLAQYKENMAEGQEHIYYITGENVDAVKNAPQLEGFKARGINVLFFTDTIDEFWLQHSLQYNDLSFKSVTRGMSDLDKFEKDDEKTEDTTEDDKKYDALIAALQKLLAAEVHNVRLSKRLADSPVCFVVPDGQADMHMERVLKIQQQYDPNTKRILEINPKHDVVKSLAAKGESVGEDDLWMLYDQACILQGEPPKDAAAFTRRLNKALLKDLAA